jgi:hypothetical protein
MSDFGFLPILKYNHIFCSFYFRAISLTYVLTLKDMGGGGLVSGADIACIPSIFIKTSQKNFW